MRIDITKKREEQIKGWTVTKPYVKLSSKVQKFLAVLKDNGEMERCELFSLAGYEANPKSDSGWSNTDFTDFRMFATGLVSLRATACPANYGYNGVKTYWTITPEGLKVLDHWFE